MTLLRQRLATRAADRARDAGRCSEAAALYVEALRYDPSRTDLRIQRANMLKDGGRLDEAEAEYRAALELRPEDADAHLQLGHVLKIRGARSAAIGSYRRAMRAEAQFGAARRELALLGERDVHRELFSEDLSRGERGLRALVGDEATPADERRAFRLTWQTPPPPQNSAAAVTVVVSLDGLSSAWLERMRCGLTAQSAGTFEAVMVGGDPTIRAQAQSLALSDDRFVIGDARVDLVDAANKARHDIVVVCEHAAVLCAHALPWFAWAAGDTPAAAFVCDADHLDAKGELESVELRQAVDHEILLQANPYGETLAVVRSRCAGELAAAAEAKATVRDLLRELARRDAVGHIPYPLAATPSADATAFSAGRNAGAAMWPATEDREALEMITLVIPTRDNAQDAKAFVGSLRILADRADRLRFVIVDNGTIEPASLGALADLAADGVVVLRVDEPFNWSRLSNVGARAADDADVVVFANDDMRMLTEGWDAALLAVLDRSEVGVVGAKLLYPDGTIQHAGMLFGWGGGPIHDGLYEARDAAGPNGRWRMRRRAPAVTGAFLAMRRRLFETIGGFDERDLPIGYSDLDICLRVRRLGLAVIYTPELELLHYESKSRGLTHLKPEIAATDRKDRETLRFRWPGELDHDVTVHPAWLDRTLPFRLLSPPSLERCVEHIRRTSCGEPWTPVEPKTRQ